MQAWNVLHSARWKCFAGPKKSPKIRHLGTIAQLCGAISSQLRHVRLRSVGEFRASQHISTGLASWHCSVTARHSSSRRQPNFAALNRGRHPYSAGRPSRWALAHILVNFGTPIYRWKWWRWMLQVWYKILLWWQMHRYIGASCARDEIRNVKERNNDKERKHTVRGMGIRPYYPRRRLRGSSKCQLLNRNPLSGFVKTVTKL